MELAEGRRGQPWRDACEYRAQARYVHMVNLFGSANSKQGEWELMPAPDITFLRPMHMTPEQAEIKAEQMEAERLFDNIGTEHSDG